MNRNTKIAIGCGGAGCLGLIVVVIAACVIYYLSRPNSNRNYNFNRNSNYNSNLNSNYNSNSNENSNSDGSTSSSSLSNDDKHKLFQAAAASNSTELTQRVWAKLGFLDSNGNPNEEYAEFFKEHLGWVFKNTEFLETINTPAKARAYVEEHIND